MSCGDRYRSQIRTSGGLTPGDPCGLFCGPDDYAEWRTEAARWRENLRVAWEHLARVRARQEIPIATEDPLRLELLELYSAFEAQPSTLWTAIFESGGEYLTNEQWVGVVTAWIDRAVCLLEQIEDQTRELGEAPRPIPRGGGEPEGGATPELGWGGWLVIGILAATAGAVGWRLYHRRSDAKEIEA